MKFLKWAALALILALCAVPANAATTLLPNGKQCFSGANGAYISGSLNMYVPNTTSFKQTWQDSSQSALNTNPIQLDANGCAIIYGVGSYRQQLYDGPVVLGVVTGNQIWDLTTTDTSAYNSLFWAGLAGGTPNVITVSDPGFNSTDGTVINFVALNTNTGSATLNPGSGAIPILKTTTSGPTSLTGGEITAGNIVSVVYYSTTASFQLISTPTSTGATTSTPLCGATGLVITNDTSFPNSKVTVTADQVVTISSSGAFISRNNVNTSVNFTTTGAGGIDTGTFSASTWYNVYVLDNGTAASALGSTSATAPTLPSGYPYKCRLGAVFANGTPSLLRTKQAGADTVFVVSSAVTTSLPVLSSGNAGAVGTGPTVSIAVANFVPPTATQMKLLATTNNTAGCVLVAGPNNLYAGNGATGTLNPPPLMITSNSTQLGIPADFVLESASIFWASTGCALYARGWKDKVNAN